MYQKPKSATTAGILGILLGGFGAHNWYLGEKTKGIIHVCLMCGGLVLWIVGIILANVLPYSARIAIAWLLIAITPIASLCMSASGIWGLVEGIMILAGGDAGLAAKGYPVANPMPQQPYPNYGQPAYGPQGYGQPMGQPMNQPMQGYGQPMSNQPMGQPMGQPMNQSMGMPGQPMNQPMPGYGQPMPNQPMGQPMMNSNNPFMNQNPEQTQNTKEASEVGKDNHPEQSN